MAKEPKTKTAAKADDAAKPAPKKAAAKPAAAKKDGAPRTDGIHKPVTPSADLATIVGEGAIPRSEVVKKVWEYIRTNDLQNPKDKREILADDKLEKIFGKKKATMFEMNKFLAQHLK